MQRGEKPERAPSTWFACFEQISGNLIVAHGFDAESAAHWLRKGVGNLSRSAPQFIAHPDLPVQLRNGEPPNADDPTTLEARRDARIIPGWNRTAATTKACVDQCWFELDGKIDDPQ
jgi:N-ethylmaleimide reductase